MANFNSCLSEYISNKTKSLGRYNLVGIPFKYIIDFSKNFSKKKLNYKGDVIEVPVFISNREIPLICSNLDLNEKELAMNIRNNTEVFSDYLFVSEKEIRLDSGENTITVFPQNWNNKKNDFLLFIYQIQENKEFKNAIKISVDDLIESNQMNSFWEKIVGFIECQSDCKKIEKTLGFAFNQILQQNEQNDIIKRLINFIADAESIQIARDKIQESANNLSDVQVRKNSTDALNAFFDFLLSIMSRNDISLAFMRKFPHYFYSPTSNIKIDSKTQEKWDLNWEYLSLEILNEIMDNIDPSKKTTFEVVLKNAIGNSNIFKPAENNLFNYTSTSSKFESNSHIDSLKINSKISPLSPSTLEYSHIEQNVLIKNNSFCFSDLQKNKSNIWRCIQLDKFKPGIGIGFSNISKYDLKSYPKEKKNNYWFSQFKLSSRNSDFMEILVNKSTEIIDAYSLSINLFEFEVGGIDFDTFYEKHINSKEVINLRNQLVVAFTEENGEYKSIRYNKPFKYEDDFYSYYVVIKTKNIITDEEFCVISELSCLTNKEDLIANNYLDKFIKEAMSQDKEEYSVECDNKKSILEEIEEFVQQELPFDANPYILSFDTEITKASIVRSFKNEKNIKKRVLADYEINSNFDDFRPEIKLPQYFLDARDLLFKEIYKTADYKSIKVSINLSLDSIKTLVIAYVNSFLKWLEQDNINPFWIDLLVLCESDRSNSSLKKPSAIIMPPYHPLKLIQLCETQQMIVEVLDKGCPGAGLVDLTTSPSNIKLRYGSSRVNNYKFYAIPQNDNYYTFLLNKDKFDTNDFLKKYFDVFKNEELFKIKFFDISNTISPSQVKKSVEDVVNIYSAKNIIKIGASDYGSSDIVSGFTDGIYNWIYENKGEKFTHNKYKIIDIYDNRKNKNEYPKAEVLRSITNDTEGTINWYLKDKTTDNDLNIVCNLPMDQFEILTCDNDLKLLNHAVSTFRLQDNENFNHNISDKISNGLFCDNSIQTEFNNLLFKFENTEALIEKSEFKSNINQIQDKIKHNKFTAISGISLDPSSFSNITSESLLYDYSTVDYSIERGYNGKFGYFLIANDQKFIKTSIKNSIKINFQGTLDDIQIDKLFSNISVNGVSNLKTLYSGGNQTRGELAVFTAFKILNQKTESKENLGFVIPLDPFLPKINSLMNFLYEKTDQKIRPDLLYFSICLNSLKLKITPIEVKFRQNIVEKKMIEALRQATAFAELLEKLFSKHEMIWKITAFDFITMLLNYGFNQIISKETVKVNATKLIKLRCALTKRLADSINNNTFTNEIEIDSIGRLIVLSPEITQVNFNKMNGGLNRLEINEEFALKCFCDESIDDIYREWNRLAGKVSFMNLDLDCTKEQLLQKKITNNNSILQQQENNFEDKDVSDIEIINIESQELIEANEVEIYDQNSLTEGILLLVGKSLNLTEKKEYYFTPSNTELNQLNIGIVGDLGTGKTQFLKNFIYKISMSKTENRGYAPKFLIFDTKKDYDLSSNSNLDIELHKSANIRTLSPSFLPLNIFDLEHCSGTNKAYTRAKFVSNIFKKIYNIGIVQENKLTNIIIDSYQRKGYKPGMSNDELKQIQYPTFTEIYELYDKDDSVKAILFDIVHSYLFESDLVKVVKFKDLFNQSLVFSLGDLVENQRELIMIILLMLYREYMLGIKKEPFTKSLTEGISLRKVDSFVLIDEANQIMDFEFDVLQDILLKGREFGVGVILSTQYLSHFKKSGVNYAESLNTWFVHKQNRLHKRDLLDIGLQSVDEQLISKIKGFNVFECLYKSLNTNDGKIIRGKPFFENFK